MSKIAIVTDSTSDLPKDLFEKHKIYITPLYVIWGTDQLKDQVDITSEAFYERLPTDPKHPTTSQPTPKDFLNTLEQAKADGAEEALIITISSQLSGTFESANIAASQGPIPTKVFDSRSASLGLGYQVLAAARANSGEADVDSLMDKALEVRNRMSLLFTVDTLDYLHKGGRIGGAQKLLGSTLNIKPQLYVDESGAVATGGRTRTRKRALSSIYQEFAEALRSKSKVRVAVTHAVTEDEANDLIELLKADLNPTEVITGLLSPVIGVHTGPGGIALSGYWED